AAERVQAIFLYPGNNQRFVGVRFAHPNLRDYVTQKGFVTPAEAGVQEIRLNEILIHWIPAFAGMTISFVRAIHFISLS
ncbi:MAG: hypothetical protein NUV34_03000, partial [Sulfuricaulis sp.]|nr:hypothetical protein [Sulfuricaulis sp.]